MSEKSKAKKKGLGLIPKLILAIFLGILAGQYLPLGAVRVFVTVSEIFGEFLNFIIPLMILGLVTKGIADLGEGAGKLLGVTVLISYISTLIGGSLSFAMAKNIFPSFITANQIEKIQAADEIAVDPYFTVGLHPLLEVTGALVFAFMMGITTSWLRGKGKGETVYGIIGDFNEIIVKVIDVAVIPPLPFFIFGNFSKMSYTGSVFAILSIFRKIFLCIIILHLIYVTVMFLIFGSYSGKNPWKLIKNQVPGYMTAVGTQSSAATIPVNMECAANNGVSREIREFVVPLCSTVHMPGSMITITSCVYTILFMYNMPRNYGLIIRFIAILGIAMVAAPGAPGGAVMSALPFLPVIGIPSDSSMATLLISLYLTQDSFGTAANISGDNAIAVAVDKIYHQKILGQKDWKAAPIVEN